MAETKKTTVPVPAAAAVPEPTTEEAPKKKREITPGGWEIHIPDGAEFGGLPKGTYISCCEEEPKETVSSKGDPQTELTYTIHDPQYPDMDGKTGKYYCSRKPKAWWNIEQTLIAMDVPYEIKKDAAGKPVIFHFNPIDCVGQMEKVIVAETTQPNGQKRNKIIQVISINEANAETSSAEEGSGESSGGDIPF